MGDGTEQNPYTREDVLRLIKENKIEKGAERCPSSHPFFYTLFPHCLLQVLVNPDVLRSEPLKGHISWPLFTVVTLYPWLP